MEANQKAARAHRAFGILYALVGGGLLAAGLAFGTWDSAWRAVMIIVVLGGLATLHFMTARGALQRKSWARNVSIVIGLLMLPGFPLGTLIGALLLSYAWKPWSTGV